MKPVKEMLLSKHFEICIVCPEIVSSVVLIKVV